MAQLELDAVSKQYRPRGRPPVPAVREVSLTVEDGEFLALLGPSGCGKTSILRMVAGLESISSGEIRISGRRVNELQTKDRNVAMSFENYGLYPPLTVRDNIGFGLRARGMPAAEVQRRVERVATMLGIGDILASRPSGLSSGQKQRVSLARALVREPDVLLLDEPLSHLDASLRVQTRKELKHLHAELGRTTVLVTHDQIEALAMADRVAVMRDGVLQQVGTPVDVYERPQNVFVAEFVGEPPMNLYQAEVIGVDGSRWASVDADLRFPLPPDAPSAASPGRRVTIGVRPADLAFELASPSSPSCAERERTVMRGRVFAFESLGEEGHLTVEVGGHRAMIVCSTDVRVQPGHSLQLLPRPDRIHLFDLDTGRRL